MTTIEVNTTRTQTELKQIISNFRTTITEIENFVEKNNFVRVVNKHEVPTLTNISVDRIKLNPFKDTSDLIDATFNKNMCKSQRKNIAKRLWNVEKKPSRKSINTLFFILRKLGIIEEKINIEFSHKEQDIHAKRKIWKKLRNESELALSNYKKEKGNFYK